MQQVVPDLTSPRVYLSPGGAGAHLSGLNKLFLGYSILDETVLGPTDYANIMQNEYAKFMQEDYARFMQGDYAKFMQDDYAKFMQ